MCQKQNNRTTTIDEIVFRVNNLLNIAHNRVKWLKTQYKGKLAGFFPHTTNKIRDYQRPLTLVGRGHESFCSKFKTSN